MFKFIILLLIITISVVAYNESDGFYVEDTITFTNVKYDPTIGDASVRRDLQRKYLKEVLNANPNSWISNESVIDMGALTIHRKNERYKVHRLRAQFLPSFQNVTFNRLDTTVSGTIWIKIFCDTVHIAGKAFCPIVKEMRNHTLRGRISANTVNRYKQYLTDDGTGDDVDIAKINRVTKYKTPHFDNYNKGMFFLFLAQMLSQLDGVHPDMVYPYLDNAALLVEKTTEFKTISQKIKEKLQ